MEKSPEPPKSKYIENLPWNQRNRCLECEAPAIWYSSSHNAFFCRPCYEAKVGPVEW